MTLPDLLDDKLHGYRTHLAWLDSLRDKELAKPLGTHDGRLLRFLYRERCMYRFALMELTAVRAETRGAR